ncbi:MAG: hypothetical protein ACTSO2_19550 [Promethearchaeota archaeon]
MNSLIEKKYDRENMKIKKNYNNFCKKKNCPEYIEWEFYIDYYEQPVLCASCKIII